MYIGQSVNPIRRFNQHALNIPTKMIIDIFKYKPFEDCFELKIVFSSYKKYSCDCESRILISKFQTTQNRHAYNLLKSHPIPDTRYWRLYRKKVIWKL
jgi:hypothetical protein